MKSTEDLFDEDVELNNPVGCQMPLMASEIFFGQIHSRGGSGSGKQFNIYRKFVISYLWLILGYFWGQDEE